MNSIVEIRKQWRAHWDSRLTSAEQEKLIQLLGHPQEEYVRQGIELLQLYDSSSLALLLCGWLVDLSPFRAHSSMD